MRGVRNEVDVVTAPRSSPKLRYQSRRAAIGGGVWSSSKGSRACSSQPKTPNLTRSQSRLLWLIYANQPIQVNHLEEVCARSPEVFQFVMNKLDALGLIRIGLMVVTTALGDATVLRKFPRRIARRKSDIETKGRYQSIMTMTRESLRKEGRFLPDGLYSVAGDIAVKELERDPFDTPTPKLDEVIVFADQYPDFVIANAYETSTCLLLSRQPDPFQGLILGTGFNYGATALIENAPKRLLILAQND